MQAQRRAPQPDQDDGGEEQPQRDRPEAPDLFEQLLGQRRADLDAEDSEQDQRRRGDPPGQRGQKGSRRRVPRTLPWMKVTGRWYAGTLVLTMQRLGMAIAATLRFPAAAPCRPLSTTRPGTTAPGTVFEAYLVRDGAELSARTPAWGGTVQSAGVPALAGELRVGGRVDHVDGRLAGGAVHERRRAQRVRDRLDPPGADRPSDAAQAGAREQAADGARPRHVLRRLLGVDARHRRRPGARGRHAACARDRPGEVAVRTLLALVGLAVLAPAPASAAGWVDLGTAHRGPVTDGDRWLAQGLGQGRVLVRDLATRRTTRLTVADGCEIGPISPGGVLLSTCDRARYEAIFLATGARRAFTLPRESTHATAVGRHWIQVSEETVDSRRTVLRNLATGATRTVDGERTVVDLDAPDPARRLCAPLRNTRVPTGDRVGTTVWGGVQYRDRAGIVTVGASPHLWRCGKAKPDKRALATADAVTTLGAGWAVSLDWRRGVSAVRVRDGRRFRRPLPAGERFGFSVAHTRRHVYLSVLQSGGTRVFRATLPSR
jgi:hypothetical protein